RRKKSLRPRSRLRPRKPLPFQKTIPLARLRRRRIVTRNGTRTKHRPERTDGTTISNSCPSACDAPGGIGKSCKALGIATEIATGQAFLNGTVYGSGLRA